MILAGIFAASCSQGANRPMDEALRRAPAPQPSAAPAREYLVWTAGGCAVGGVEHGPDRAFVFEGKRCGCYDGDRYCVDAREPPRCFYNGKWYDDAVDPTYGRRCRCVNPPEWSCRDLSNQEILSDRAAAMRRYLMTPCPNSWHVLPFSPGSIALSTDTLAKIDYFAEYVEWTVKRKPETQVMVEAHGDPKEEPRGSSLAQSRAEAVRDALVSRGVDSHRIDVRNLGTRPVPASNRWLPLCTPAEDYDPGPKVIFWWEW